MNNADLEAIRAAVAEAEQNTSGEIVPYLVEESDGYPSALWKGTALGAFAGALLAEAIYFLGDFWGGMIPLWIALPAAAGGAVGFLLSAYVPAIKRWMAGDSLLDLRTRQRAEMAFLEEEVFRTRDRTGILLFLSLFEHRVIVIGDSGINQQVEQGQWDGIVKTMAAGIRAGRPGDALVEGIRQCGALLERHGVAIKPDDLDELSNELRRGDR
jgi:putative membrane protein